MPRSTYQRLLGFIGKLVVVLILGFLVLPAAVVTIAAFNDKAILSFPPQAWSMRWFAKAIAYQDFRDGFRNGLIVTAWSSTMALVVGAMFAFALDRYRFRFKRAIEGVLLSPLVDSAFYRRARFPDPGRADRMEPQLCGRHRLPHRPRAAFRAAQRLCLPAQSRSEL